MNLDASSLRAFGQWWAEQMRDMLIPLLPRPLRSAMRAFRVRMDKPHIIIDSQHGTVSIAPHFPQDTPQSFESTPDGLAQLTRALMPRRHRLFSARRSVSVAVTLSGLSVLERRVRIPAAIRDDAHQLVQYELDRLTPFPPEDVIWSLDHLYTDRKNGTADFRLQAVPRGTVSAWLDTLRAQGLRPATLSGTQGPFPGATLRLDHSPTRPSRKWLLCAAAVLLFAVFPFARQSLTSYRLDSALQSLQVERDTAEMLRARLDAITTSAAVLAREADGIVPPLPVLAELTDALPDGTFLESLTLKSHHLEVEGQSREATRLISILEHTGNIRAPAFSGPVIHAPNTQGDHFSIRASIDMRPRRL